MATNAIVIGWGPAVRGREHKALQGMIESFEPVALEPHGGELEGFLLIRGDSEKLSKLRNSEEFLRLNNRAALIVDNLGVINAFIGEELQRQFADIDTQASELA